MMNCALPWESFRTGSPTRNLLPSLAVLPVTVEELRLPREMKIRNDYGIIEITRSLSLS